jgi:ATP phosphoribosyltransferase
MEYLNIALPKGRIGKDTLALFNSIGIKSNIFDEDSRKLVLLDEKNLIKYFLVKPIDVPTYVEYGTADMGVVGKDTLMEEGKNLYEVLDLGFGKCKMVVAGFKKQYATNCKLNNPRVATKYPTIAKEYFSYKRNESIEIIKLNGSVELAPLVGLAEYIVDIVESGKTLKENGLEVLEDIADISARLVVNRVSLKMKKEKINNIIDRIREKLVGKK